ncbi:MAG TPA: S41 family peptidase [Dyella sp.]|uniref:S41 family peptidase n=1 Tax=Dyella sp. TaxID=1869338 RepID=UPI002F93D52B
MPPYLRGLLLGLALSALPAASPAVETSYPPTTTALTSSQAREDLELAIAALEAALPNIYWHQTPTEWRQAKTIARAHIAQIDDSEGLWRVLMPLVARIGEGHLSLAVSDAMKKRERDTGLLLPLSVLWNEQGAYVIAGYGEAADLPRGTRIVSIQGKPVQTLADDLMFAATRDGAIRTGILREASGNGYGVLLYRMIGSQSVFRLVLETADGKRIIRDVAGIPAAARTASTSPALSPIATLEWLDAGTAYLNVPTFSNKRYREAGANYEATIQKIFDELAQRNARNLILDLRDNGGGSEPNESILFSYLVEAPLRKYAAVEARGRHISVRDLSGTTFETEVFDDGEMKLQHRLPNGRLLRRNIPPEGLMTRWGRSSPVYRGRLVVLAGGNTFSGGAELASMLFHVRRAVFVGEEAGGTHEGNTSGYRWPVTLPNSGMTLRIPLLQFRFAWPGLPKDRGVRPDCAAPPNVWENGNTKDAAWRLARDMLRTEWATPDQATCPAEIISLSR